LIILHRLNNSEIVVNCNLIETLESTPDTVITLNNEKKMIVKEKVDEVIRLVIEFQRKIYQNKINPQKNKEK
jgi:flagellar protein FlbD